MKASELRIGNYVSLTYMKSKTCKVYSLQHNKCVFNVTDDDFVSNTIYQYITPIQLTEDWKNKVKENEFLLIDVSGFVIFKNRYAYQFVFKYYPYLHQLQNLYFDLVGEELIIK